MVQVELLDRQNLENGYTRFTPALPILQNPHLGKM